MTATEPDRLTAATRPAAAPLDAAAFRQAGHALIDWIADYREKIGDRAVAHLPEPGAIRAMLPPRAPEFGEPMARIQSCAGYHTTNMAYGGTDGRTLFITESETGTLLAATTPVPGLTPYSHA